MERHGSFWLLMGILLLIRHAAAQNKTDIPRHVTLSPFWGWISAAECLHRYQKTSSCEGKKVLTLDGVIVVNKTELNDYCGTSEGCGKRTLDVLDCIRSVKRDFRFASKANISFVQDAIRNGCRNFSEINTTNYTSSNAIKLLASCSGWNTLFLSTLVFMILLILTDIHLIII